MPRGNFNLGITSELSPQEPSGRQSVSLFLRQLSLEGSYWEGTSLRLFLPRGYCGVIYAARQRFTSIGPLGSHTLALPLPRPAPPVPRPASPVPRPVLAQSSPGPRFKQSSRQNVGLRLSQNLCGDFFQKIFGVQKFQSPNSHFLSSSLVF